MDRQEATFTAWVNAVLAPSTAEPSNAAMARLAARTRGWLWSMYQADAGLQDVMVRVEARIDTGQLRIGSEALSLRNVKEQAAARRVLLSYHPFWLTAALEVVVGKSVDSVTVAKPGCSKLEAFVREHVLCDPGCQDAAAPRRVGAGAARKEDNDLLGRLALKRILLLVLLLDRAAERQDLEPGLPLLFLVDAPHKSSASALQGVLGRWLGSEGDLARTLGRYGYRLSHAQHPKRELDWRLPSLAVGLRDGLRLCRLVDALTGRPGLVDAARFPAAARPARLFNVSLALEALARHGVRLEAAAPGPGATPRPGVHPAAPMLVDGDRAPTLDLLWRAFLRLDLPRRVRGQALQTEIDRLAAGRGDGTGGGGQGGDHAARLAGVVLPPAVEADAGPAAGLLRLVLCWAAAATGCAQGAAGNIAATYGDGRLLCLLVREYLGEAVLPRSEIYEVPPALLASTGAEDPQQQAWALSCREDAAARQYRAGVQSNFDRVALAMEALGGSGALLSGEDVVEHGTDDRSVLLALCGMCSRLLEASREERGAMTIQRLWRRRAAAPRQGPGAARAHLHAWIAAASRVQAAYRRHVFLSGLEAARRDRAARLEAATRLQALWRGRAARLALHATRAAAVTLQALWHGRQARRQVLEEKLLPRLLAGVAVRRAELAEARTARRQELAAAAMQTAWRASHGRRAFLKARRAAPVLQAHVRGWLERARLARRRSAAILIQAAARGWAVRRHEQTKARAAQIIQAHWRQHRLQGRDAENYRRLREAAVLLQRRWRAVKAARLAAAHAAATRIQRMWRGSVGRRAFLAWRGAAEMLQRHWRGHHARRRLATEKSAALAVQAAWRGWRARRERARLHAAALAVQRVWRGHAARRQLRLDAAAIFVQRHARGFLARRAHHRRRGAAVTIQRAFRAHLEAARAASVAAMKAQMEALARAMQDYSRRAAAARRLQAGWRGCLERRHLAAVAAQEAAERARRAAREAAARATIAPWASVFLARIRFLKLRRAVVLAQRAWRSEYARRCAASIVIQAQARAWLGVRALRRRRAAALRLQAAWRGGRVRQTHPQKRRLAEARGRLRVATEAAHLLPPSQRTTLASRTATALSSLTAVPFPEVACGAWETLARCTAASNACAQTCYDAALPIVMAVLRSGTKAGSNVQPEAIRHAVMCLAHMGRNRSCLDAMLATDEVLLLLAALLQRNRDKEELFLALVSTIRAFLPTPARALNASRRPAFVATVEGVGRMLALKAQNHMATLNKLERAKGSDVSARQATKALVTANRQLLALNRVLSLLGLPAAGAGPQSANHPQDPMHGPPAGSPGVLQRLGKNTIVRGVLQALNH
ncbi:hypothetical protein ACKKBG_A01865 [Auxenochlorella protothecoides x Auxenochlorella symbiontica]